MRTATSEEIVVLELLVEEMRRRSVEQDLACAVSVAGSSVVPRERDRHVGLAKRAVARDHALVLDDAS